MKYLHFESIVVKQNVFKVSRQLIIRLMVPNYHLILAKMTTIDTYSWEDKFAFNFI